MRTITYLAAFLLIASTSFADDVSHEYPRRFTDSGQTSTMEPPAFFKDAYRIPAIVKIDATGVIVIGSLTKEQVAKVLAAYMGRFQYCYEREVQRHPKLKGDVTVQFNIVSGGNVDHSAIIASTLKNTKAESCIQKVLGAMPFPSTSAPTQATIPFQFSLKK